MQMYHGSNDLLPYRCPSCQHGKRFRSLIALRLHTSIVHDNQTALTSQRQHTGWNVGNFMSGQNNSIVGPPASLQVFVGESQSNKGLGSVSFDKALSSTSVDEMFNKYSMKIDQVLEKYDSKSKNLENKLNLAKQLEEIRKQRQQLRRIRASWTAVHGVSQLVDDTEAVINKSICGDSTIEVKPRSASFARKKNIPRAASSPVMNSPSTEQQLDLSIQLTAQYKALALGAEEKLKEKMEDEHQLKHYIEATAAKEKEAKTKLADFIESLLLRAEEAETKLEMYESQTSGLNTSDSYNANDLRNSLNGQRALANQRQRSKTTDSLLSLEMMSSSRLSDSGIAVSSRTPATTKAAKETNGSRASDDPYVQAIVERPDDVASPTWPGNAKLRGRVGGKQPFDVAKFVPFSNVPVAGENSDVAADRRVALFCVFSSLRSIDLLRCAMVCREWRDVSRHPQLWSRVRLHDVNLDPNLLKLISRWSNETCSLCLKNVGLMSSDKNSATGALEGGLEMLLKSCSSRLLVLSIDQCDPVITSRALWLVSCYNRRIQSISYRSSIDPISHQVAWALGSTCRDILSLEVAPLQPCSVRGLFDNNVARLLSWCWSQLQALSFGGQDIDGSGLLAVALNCHHLKVLELDHAKGVTENHAWNACKHGLKELKTLLFTHTPVQAATLLCFLETLSLDSLHVVVAQKDYFRKGKYQKIRNEYARISKALMNLPKNAKFAEILCIHCE